MKPTDDLKFPTGWFYAGRTKDLAQIQKISLPGGDVILYLGDSGNWHAVQPRCPHMNADLSKAKIRGDGLQCSLHQWSFNSQGKCTGIPGARSEQIPEFAKLTTYSVATRHGHVFIHRAPGKEKVLPFFENENPDDFQCASVRPLYGNNHWIVPAANAFDLAHFEYVHQRKPTATPSMLRPNEEARQLKMDYEILSKEMADKWLVSRYGKKAHLDYTVWNGNLIIAKTKIGEFENRMMVFIQPHDSGWKAWLFVFTPKSNSPLKKLGTELTAFFSYRFFAKECLELDGVQINQETLGPRDHLMSDYMKWVTTL